MYNFFANENNKSGNCYHITDKDCNHIVNVLRMKTGDELLVSCSGTSSLCRIAEISDGVVIAEEMEFFVIFSKFDFQSLTGLLADHFVFGVGRGGFGNDDIGDDIALHDMDIAANPIDFNIANVGREVLDVDLLKCFGWNRGIGVMFFKMNAAVSDIHTK